MYFLCLLHHPPPLLTKCLKNSAETTAQVYRPTSYILPAAFLGCADLSIYTIFRPHRLHAVHEIWPINTDVTRLCVAHT